MEISISGISEALAARRGDTEYSKKRKKEIKDSKGALRKSLGRSESKEEDASALEQEYAKK